MAKGGYDFYLDKCLLSVAPPKLQLKVNNANETVTLINGGEVNILKTPGLTDIEFECRIPQEQYPFAVYKSGFQGADYFLGQFEALKAGRKPFQFIVCRQRPDGRDLFHTNMRVTLEEYRVTEDAEEGFDLLVKVKLKQWRDYGTRTVDVDIPTGRASVGMRRETSGSPAPSSAQSYTVAKGDCLWNIAKKFYGNGAKYTAIYNANKGTIGGNPNLIYPGQVLVIPAA